MLPKANPIPSLTFFSMQLDASLGKTEREAGIIVSSLCTISWPPGCYGHSIGSAYVSNDIWWGIKGFVEESVEREKHSFI